MTLRTLEDLGDARRASASSSASTSTSRCRTARSPTTARIRRHLPTLRELLERGASLVLGSPSRPARREVSTRLRLAPVGERLAELLGEPVRVCADPGRPARFPTPRSSCSRTCGSIRARRPNDPAFAGALAALADVYVDDAFGAAHRAHASVVGAARPMRSSGRAAVAGRLLEREVEVLRRSCDDPDRPYVAILGGAKVSDKLGGARVADRAGRRVAVGGAMAFTLIAADGGEIGD